MVQLSFVSVLVTCPACYVMSPYSLQLAEVDGCNMWVMETGGPSSDPPQTGHLQQKVHAQQSPASSSERSAMTGMLLLRGTPSSPNAHLCACCPVPCLCVTYSIMLLSYV